MVRVLAVADEESASVQSSRVREQRPDVLVSAGDLSWDYLEQLAATFDVPAVLVPGNHDLRTGHGRPRGFVDGDGLVTEVAGLRIAGHGGCVRYNQGEHQYTQQEHERRAQRLIEAAGGPVDVLLTHAPPFGLGDEPDDPPHRGIEALHGVIEALRPRWHLHGHIHPHGFAKPDRQVGGTTVRNVIPWQVVDVEPRSIEREAV